MIPKRITVVIALFLPFSLAHSQVNAPKTQQQERIPMRVGASAPPAVKMESPDYAKVSTTVALGPMGYLQMPTGLTQVAGANSNLGTVNLNYNFPAVYIYISASPLLFPKLSDATNLDSIDSVQDGDRDINWMDASFDLVAKDVSGNALPCETSVQVLGLLPGATVTSLKTPVANAAATAANQLVTALAPFFSGAKTVAEASTSAFQVLFTDLFPPKPVAYQYAFLDGACSFGWYFKPNPTTTPPTSVLGTQTALVLLRTSMDVASIGLSSRILSRWTHPPTKSSKQFSYLEKTDFLAIPTVKSAIDFGNLQDLSLFPLLIPAADARSILHIGAGKDADWNSLIKPQAGTTQPLIQTTPDGAFVIKASLQQYLQLTSK